MEPPDAPHRDGGIWRGKLSEREAAHEGPPYQVIASDFLLNVVSLDPQATKAVLPEGTSCKDEPTGLIGFYRATSGTGLGPYSGCFVAVEVQGCDVPEGSSVFVKVAGWYSGRAGHVMHNLYDRRLLAGEVRHWQDGDIWGAEGGPEGTCAMAAEVRRTGQEAPFTPGTHYYLGFRSDKAVNFYSIAFVQSFVGAECRRLEISPGAPPALKLLNPRSEFCYYCPTAFLTFGRPQKLSGTRGAGAPDAARLMLLDMFLRLGRAAAVVGEGGRLLYLNRMAEGLVGQGFLIAGQRMRAEHPANQAAFLHMIEHALAGEQTTEPIALKRSSTPVPLLARAMPMDRAAWGEGAVLVLLTNPLENAAGDLVKMLRLLGLSPAEARIAVLVGTGHPPKEVAAELRITENTVRSVLKVIYGKLSIHRQSELAQMVARLRSL